MKLQLLMLPKEVVLQVLTRKLVVLVKLQLLAKLLLQILPKEVVLQMLTRMKAARWKKRWWPMELVKVTVPMVMAAGLGPTNAKTPKKVPKALARVPKAGASPPATIAA